MSCPNNSSSSRNILLLISGFILGAYTLIKYTNKLWSLLTTNPVGHMIIFYIILTLISLMIYLLVMRVKDRKTTKEEIKKEITEILNPQLEKIEIVIKQNTEVLKTITDKLIEKALL